MNQTTFFLILSLLLIFFLLLRHNLRESFTEPNPTQAVTLHFNRYTTPQEREKVRFHLCLKMKNAQLKRPFNRIEYQQAKEVCQQFSQLR